jgi:hypothetical protein
MGPRAGLDTLVKRKIRSPYRESNPYRPIRSLVTLQLYNAYYGILGKCGGNGVDWMHLAQDRDQWLALVNVVMNLRVP